MADRSDADSIQQDLAAAKKRRAELHAELEQVDRRIAELERQSAAAAPSQPAGTDTHAPRAASAWDRAVQAMRRKPAAAEPKTPASARPAPQIVPVADKPPAPRTPPQPTTVKTAPTRPEAKDQTRISPPPPPDGPSFLQAVESDDRLAPNQREALREVYQRFVPVPAPRVDGAPTLPADEALDRDPALGRGQREAIRTVLDRFLHNPVR